MSATANQVFFDDKNDLEGVVSRYFPMLLRVAFRRLRNIEDAEDAVQDALLSAHKYIGQFQGRSKLSTWLTRIVTNTALMKLRRHSRYRMLPLPENGESEDAARVSELIDTRPSPETIYAKTEADQILLLSLAQLTPKLRAAIQMCELEGIPIPEAASILGLSRNALKSRVARARKSLNLILSEAIPRRPVSRPTIGVNRDGASQHMSTRSVTTRGVAASS